MSCMVGPVDDTHHEVKSDNMRPEGWEEVNIILINILNDAAVTYGLCYCILYRSLRKRSALATN
jgi:hypothetical protein